MTLDKLKDIFTQKFGKGGEIISVLSPGRVNLIGEYTDFNKGFVLPYALNFGSTGLIRKREDKKIYLHSVNMNSTVIYDLESLFYTKENSWTNYLKGVIIEILKKGREIPGFELLIYGDIPNGAGLSSSASIEILMGVSLNELFQLQLSTLDIVLMALECENNFVGVKCGIMDQYTVAFGEKGKGLLLDCKKNNHKYTPLDLEGYELIIGNTNKRRGLTDSKYNERRRECEEAVAILQKGVAMEFLCDINPSLLEENIGRIKNEVIAKRARHVVYENARVLATNTCLQNKDYQKMGTLLYESHQSLQKLFEVTGKELDALVEAAYESTFTIGSRMTGAGYGGCTINIVKKENIEDFIAYTGEKYKEKIGLKADFYIADSGNGAMRLD